MKKEIEIVIYEYNGLTEVEGINDGAYTDCTIPLEALGINEVFITYYRNIYRTNFYRNGELKDIEGIYIINGKELNVYRKKIDINL